MALRIAIVGCGPAGLSSAVALHDAGFSVTLYERFEAPHPVGSGLMLQPTGLAVLEWLGLRQQVELSGQRINGMLGKTVSSNKTVLDIKYTVLPGDLYGVAIHRATLFHVLHEAVKARNIHINTDWDVGACHHDKSTVSLSDVHDQKISAQYDLIVDASGRQSKLVALAELKTRSRPLDYGALWSTVRLGDHGFSKQLLEQRYRAASIMAGVLPCGQLPGQQDALATLFWSIKSADYDQTVARGIDALKHDICKIWPAVEPLLQQITDFSQLSFAQYSHHTLKKPYSQRIAFIGDAAHATSPQLGQGANMALLDAKALTAALTHAQTIDAALQDYARLRRMHVRLFQAASLSLTPLYQSDSVVFPWIRDTFFQPVSKLPFAARLMTSLGAGTLAQPVQKISAYEAKHSATRK